MQISPPSPSSCLLLCFTPPLFSAAAARGRPGGHLLLALAAHASRPTLLHRPLPSRCASPALPRTQTHPPTATSPSRWRARCRAPETYLACASEPGTTPHSIPLVPTLFRCLHIPGHHHRPLNAGEFRPTVNPPFQTRSAPKDPANSFASTSRSSQTPLPRPISTGATPARRVLSSNNRCSLSTP